MHACCADSHKYLVASPVHSPAGCRPLRIGKRPVDSPLQKKRPANNAILKVSARWSIGDFSEDGGPPRARGGWKIRGALMKRLVSEKSEGEGFLGVFGDTEVRGRKHFDVREGHGKLREDKRIVRAAARDDDLLDFVFAKDETVKRVDDGKSREDRGGANEVGGLGVMLAA